MGMMVRMVLKSQNGTTTKETGKPAQTGTPAKINKGVSEASKKRMPVFQK